MWQVSYKMWILLQIKKEKYYYHKSKKLKFYLRAIHQDESFDQWQWFLFKSEDVHKTKITVQENSQEQVYSEKKDLTKCWFK